MPWLDVQTYLSLPKGKSKQSIFIAHSDLMPLRSDNTKSKSIAVESIAKVTPAMPQLGAHALWGCAGPATTTP